jgi:hypothetical protein
MAKSKIKIVGRFVLDTHLWNPTKAAVLYNHYFSKNRESHASNEKHIKEALAWLKRAHDASNGKGVSGRYLFDRGWTNPYPETSGYIVPTFLDLAEYFDDPDCIKRSEKIIEFLLSVQMDDGAFPGGEYNKNYKQHPIVFNTGQIIIGLVAWYNRTGDTAVADSLMKAADWLVKVQEEDGSWEKYTYGKIKTAYHSRVAWPLALYGSVFSERKYQLAADNFVEWILKNTNSDTGWISYMDFVNEYHLAEKSITHTLAYTYRGLLEYAMLNDRQDVMDLVLKANDGIVTQFLSSGYMSGILNSKWQNTEKFTCLTGNCQLAIIWLKLYGIYNEDKYVLAAERILSIVKKHQSFKNLNGGIRGGIPGSVPLWSQYIRLGYPNWAAKFFIDALMLLERIKKEQSSNNSES